MVVVYCLQEVLWREPGSMMLGMEGRFKWWWCKYRDGFGVVGDMVEENVCEQFFEMRRCVNSLLK